MYRFFLDVILFLVTGSSVLLIIKSQLEDLASFMCKRDPGMTNIILKFQMFYLVDELFDKAFRFLSHVLSPCNGSEKDTGGIAH